MAPKLSKVLFYHKTLHRVFEANITHEYREFYPENRKSEQEEIIDYARQVYRGFLEEVMMGVCSPEISERERDIFVDEAYRKSNFDWRDKAKFDEFFDWIGRKVKE